MLRDMIRALAALCLLAIYAAVIFWPHYGLRAHPALFAVVVAVQLLITLLVVLKPAPRRRLLRWAFTGLGLAAVAACASGCSGLGGLGLPGGTDQAAILNAVNAHIEGCERHYHGQTVPPSLSVQIDCPARPGGAPLATGAVLPTTSTLTGPQ